MRGFIRFLYALFRLFNDLNAMTKGVKGVERRIWNKAWGRITSKGYRK